MAAFYRAPDNGSSPLTGVRPFILRHRRRSSAAAVTGVPREIRSFLLSLTVLAAGTLGAQQSSRTEPVAALRANATGYHALVGARVVTGPGQALDNATIVIRNGWSPPSVPVSPHPPAPVCGR